jgi:hypothetical protein
MTTETFFEKFELFADAPGAVKGTRGLVLDYSANGAPHTSLGQRPDEYTHLGGDNSACTYNIITL